MTTTSGATYPYVAPDPCWLADGDHFPTRTAATATGRDVEQAEERCVRAECFGCSTLVDLVALHCSSWSTARDQAVTAGWHVEDHRRLIWCPTCWPARPPGPPPPGALDPDQIALTDYVS